MSWRPGRPVRLTTDRFVIRSLTPEDASDRYLGWLADEEVMRYVNARFETPTWEKLLRYIAEGDDAVRFRLGVFTREDELHIGNYAAECHPVHRRADLGVLIGDRAWWGKGVVLETRPAVLGFLLGPAGMEKVCGECYGNNAPALLNYAKEGWEKEGILKSHAAFEDGRVDVVRFAVFRDGC